jgi:hypothetical protein
MVFNGRNFGANPTIKAKGNSLIAASVTDKIQARISDKDLGFTYLSKKLGPTVVFMN